MFFDEAKIYLRSGDGGDGMISFRREKYVPFGGPDGGDGGDGGNVIFEVNPKLNSLSFYKRKIHFKADRGVHGLKSNMTGARGKPMVLQVPPGTILREAETGRLLADLTNEEQRVTLLEGGKGGRGNARFASSTTQAPKIAERGTPGIEMWITLELKLIADAGLVGKPNAGKSTLLSMISEAKPKVANYPFTTLQPSLGVVKLEAYETLVVADIPGLIEGAAQGVGLGHDFLRHIERTRVLIHLLDGAAFSPLEDFDGINEELKLYDAGLENKPQIVVLNKMDLPDAQAWEPLLREEVEARGYEFMAISAMTRENTRQLVYRVKQMVNELPEPEPEVQDVVVIRPKEDPNQFFIEQIGPREWLVRGERIEQIATQTYFEFSETAQRFQRIIDRLGISAALKKRGVQDGDSVWFGEEVELEWQADD